MPTNAIVEIDQAIQDLYNNGFAILKGYFIDEPDLNELKMSIYKLVCLKAKQCSIELPDNSQESINGAIIQLNTVNNKIGGFLNDTLNATPSLFRLLSSKKIHKLAQSILKAHEGDVILGNNYRIRVQIPGRDEISNLPWHQDSHYNNFYKHNNSIVIWTSVYDIDEETGPVVFKRGSHIIKQVPQIEHIKENGNKVYTVEGKYINDTRFEECCFPTQSGDVVLIDMDVLHRSGLNNSKDNVKFSLQGRYHNASTKNFLPHYN